MSDNDKVICPNCVHEFRAIPVNVQDALRAAEVRIAALEEALEKIAKPRGAIWSPDTLAIVAGWRKHVSEMQKIADAALAQEGGDHG